MNSLTGKTILVTGATGFIGGYLTRALHADGANVLALERTPGRGDTLAQEGIQVVRGDVTDHTRMAEIVNGSIDVMIHAAAHLRGGSRGIYEAVNVCATRHLAQACAAVGVERFVFVSSVAVYGLVGNKNIDESAPLAPYGNPYGDSKIHGEKALREVAEQTGLAYSIARPGMVYGPGSPGWTVRLARWAMKGRLPIVDGGTGTAYPIYITDLVSGLILCATRAEAVGKAFNFVDDGPITWDEFFGGYMDMIPTQRAWRLPGLPLEIAARIVAPLIPVLNLPWIVDGLRGTGLISNQSAKDLLGWHPKVALREGLRHSEAWLRSRGMM